MYFGESAFVNDFMLEKTASRGRDMSRAAKRKRAFKGESAPQKVVNQTANKITYSAKSTGGIKNIGQSVSNVGKEVSSITAKRLGPKAKKIGVGAAIGAASLGAGAGLLKHHFKNKQAALYMDAIEKVALYR